MYVHTPFITTYLILQCRLSASHVQAAMRCVMLPYWRHLALADIEVCTLVAMIDFAKVTIHNFCGD